MCIKYVYYIYKQVLNNLTNNACFLNIRDLETNVFNVLYFQLLNIIILILRIIILFYSFYNIKIIL